VYGGAEHTIRDKQQNTRVQANYRKQPRLYDYSILDYLKQDV
jgi:hypothetical protein